MGRLPLSESPSENGVSLSPQSFQQLGTLLYPVIDLFAHPGNAKLPAFGCPFPFPSATVVDALATNWYRWKRIYLFPPSRPDSSLPPKTARLQRLRAGHRPSASFRSLVARVPSRLHPTRRRPRHRAMGARRMAESQRENVLSRFQFLKNLYSRRYEAPVALALSNAHRGSTRDQYEHRWKDFQRWLTSNPSKPISKGSVLLYLTHLAQTRGLSPKRSWCIGTLSSFPYSTDSISTNRTENSPYWPEASSSRTPLRRNWSQHETRTRSFLCWNNQNFLITESLHTIFSWKPCS